MWIECFLFISLRNYDEDFHYLNGASWLDSGGLIASEWSYGASSSGIYDGVWDYRVLGLHTNVCNIE